MRDYQVCAGVSSWKLWSVSIKSSIFSIDLWVARNFKTFTSASILSYLFVHHTSLRPLTCISLNPFSILQYRSFTLLLSLPSPASPPHQTTVSSVMDFSFSVPCIFYLLDRSSPTRELPLRAGLCPKNRGTARPILYRLASPHST